MTSSAAVIDQVNRGGCRSLLNRLQPTENLSDDSGRRLMYKVAKNTNQIYSCVRSLSLYLFEQEPKLEAIISADPTSKYV